MANRATFFVLICKKTYQVLKPPGRVYSINPSRRSGLQIPTNNIIFFYKLFQLPLSSSPFWWKRYEAVTITLFPR